MSVTTIHVGPQAPAGADGSYDVLVGHGVLHHVTDLIPAGAQRVLLAHSEAVPGPLATVAEALSGAGLEVHLQPFPDGEDAKTIDVIAHCWGVMGQAGFTRSDVVVALGGGAVTDAAGFVAASWLRGCAVIQIPTTLLAMVDAAVGGKTGINTAEGKNLVGAFHPPIGVLVDLDTLTTLPRRDLVAGLAEVVKAGFIADERILTLVETDLETGAQAALDPGSPVLRELVERAIAVKADVVTRDLKESSLREILNYGHTFAHAIEQGESFTWRHGDAVAVGMMYAVELARIAGKLGDDASAASIVERHRRVIGGLGLPLAYHPGRWDTLRATMGRDKKTRGSTLRFVVLDGQMGRCTRLEAPTEAQLEAAYEAVSRIETAS